MENAFIIPTTGKEKGKKRFVSAGTQARMKSMFNLMFDYAYAREIVDRNYARAFEISKEIRRQQAKDKRVNVPFSDEEIQVLWGMIEKIKFVDMILIAIYSGWRPQELSMLKVEDINLQEDIMTGGMKTEAGTDRVVPIHPLVRELVVARVADAKELGSEYLFNNPDGQQGIYMTYDKYRVRFNKVMKRLEMKHHPHETRHTFITKAKKYRMDDNLLKLIVGHEIVDITERVYTHRVLDDLKEAMLMIKE